MALSDLQKFEIVSKYNNENWSIKKIAESMKINRNTVSLWVNRYAKNKSLDRKRGTGMIKNKNID